MDSDLPADHQSSSSAYQPAPVAPAWAALHLLSVTAQDVEHHRQRLSRISGALLALSQRLLTVYRRLMACALASVCVLFV